MKALFVGQHARAHPGPRRARQPGARAHALRLCARALGRRPAGQPGALALRWPLRRRCDVRQISQRVLATGAEIERKAAALALADCPPPEAEQLLAGAPDSSRRSASGRPQLSTARQRRRRSRFTPGGRPHALHRPARPHDLAHHRRLRGDGRGRHRRRDRARLLDRPAAHQCRHLRRLSLRRSSASSASAPASSACGTTAASVSTRRRPTTRSWPRACWRSCRASRSRRAWSRSARSATTSRPPLEDKYFRAQLELAKELELPVMIHTPHRDKKRGTLRSMDVVEEHGLRPELVVIDHNNEETVREVLDRGFWAAFSIYPHTKMGNERMAEIVRQLRAGADHRRLGLRLGHLRSAGGAEDRELMAERGIPEAHIEADLLPERARRLRPERPDAGGRLAQPAGDRPAHCSTRATRSCAAARRRGSEAPSRDLENLTIS